MMEEELMKIWQSSPKHERIKFEKSRLMIEAQSNIDRFHKLVKYRDMREQIGAAIGIPIFAYYAYQTPFLMSKIGSALVILWGLYVVIRLQNAKKHKPSAFSETYKDYLHRSREYIRIQRQLLDTALYWYILPIAVSLLVFIVGPGVAGRIPKIIKMSALVAAVAIAAHALNRRAVKKQFIPRLEKIDELLLVLEEPQ